MLPDGRENNPYQRLLQEALEGKDVSVRFDEGESRMPLLGAIRQGPTPDVIHLHWTHKFIVSDKSWVGFLLSARFLVELLVLRMRGIPVVWTLHNIEDHARRQPQLERTVNRFVVRLYDAVLAHCPTAVDEALETYGLDREHAHRFHVVPHGHYEEPYPDTVTQEEARRDLDLPREETIYLFFGNVRPYKGVVDLVDRFRAGDIAGRLVVAGNPADEETARRVRESASDDPSVRLHLGFVEGDEIQRYMRAADVVVLPFRDVTSSGSLLLAMTFGRAVVAPRIGCVADALEPEQPELLYDPEDEGALEQALQKARDLDLETIGARNRDRAMEWDWERIADRTLDVYEDVTG